MVLIFICPLCIGEVFILKKNTSVVQCRHQRHNGVDAGVMLNGVDTSNDIRYSTLDCLLFCSVLMHIRKSYSGKVPRVKNIG